MRLEKFQMNNNKMINKIKKLLKKLHKRNKIYKMNYISVNNWKMF